MSQFGAGREIMRQAKKVAELRQRQTTDTLNGYIVVAVAASGIQSIVGAASSNRALQELLAVEQGNYVGSELISFPALVFIS